jgi:hypothetical protein
MRCFSENQKASPLKDGQPAAVEKGRAFGSLFSVRHDAEENRPGLPGITRSRRLMSYFPAGFPARNFAAATAPFAKIAREYAVCFGSR